MHYKTGKQRELFYQKLSVACPIPFSMLFGRVKDTHPREIVVPSMLTHNLSCLTWRLSCSCSLHNVISTFFIYFIKTGLESVKHVQRRPQGHSRPETVKPFFFEVVTPSHLIRGPCTDSLTFWEI